VNDYSHLVPTNARILLIYVSPYLAPTFFGWLPSSGSVIVCIAQHTTTCSFLEHFKLARHNPQVQDPIRIVT